MLTCTHAIQREYASEVGEKLTKIGLHVDVDNGPDTLQKKIRNGEIAQYNFILGAPHLAFCFVLNVVADVQTCAPVVGQEELDNRSVNVRNRDDVGTKARTESLPLDVIIGKLSALKETRGIHNKLA